MNTTKRSVLTPVKESHGAIFCDALLASPEQQLLLASFWGRDTGMQEFIARLSLSESEDGISTITLPELESDDVPMSGLSPKNLDKLTGRVPTRTFGDLNHVFVFDPKALKPDYANASAVMVSVDGLYSAVWETVKDVCPLPLLDQWWELILGFLRSNQQLREVEGFGIAAKLIGLDVETIEEFIEECARSGIIAG